MVDLIAAAKLIEREITDRGNVFSGKRTTNASGTHLYFHPTGTKFKGHVTLRAEHGAVYIRLHGTFRLYPGETKDELLDGLCYVSGAQGVGEAEVVDDL